MKFGVLYEHQIPRPWKRGAELRLFQEALDQVELADRLGIDYAWEVEHHFLEEYSHSSAPEVFLAACSQRTQRIRLGHGIVLMPPAYNHPARVAERIATLDLVSRGRIEFGTGESSSLAELGGFGVSVAEKRAQWREAAEQTANMLAMEPYPGFEGKYFSMPCRNVVPKPVQTPHPPMWMACSNRESIRIAAKYGLGALTFAFIDQEEAKKWVAEYYAIIKSTECVPIGHTVNANIAMVTGFGCHADPDEALRRAGEGFQFFGYSLGHHYIFGVHKPGRTDIWREFAEGRDSLPRASSPGIGSPEQVRAHMRRFSDAGVDQVIFVQQAGNNRHDQICEALELFALDVMPEFKQQEDERVKQKEKSLAPYVEQALSRKQWMRTLDDMEIPEIRALGRKISEEDENNPVSAVRSAAATTSGGVPIPTRKPTRP
jgi:alkanesulfonate monooxygenase SsuD/methylene tetrahydromethanopterin reductase-like flavin-dependent oxidoreductase (luciferase family)